MISDFRLAILDLTRSAKRECEVLKIKRQESSIFREHFALLRFFASLRMTYSLPVILSEAKNLGEHERKFKNITETCSNVERERNLELCPSCLTFDS